ncbi:FMN-dependent oxidoreductase (nitrilotriacetate monooxygenase family) [Azospirillum agricola]|uniref:NtaA/DmoA family FMN-dependent monooxygenase n=1 Tax=Azospirillum agricola TaxID=1720247 RepID=UPI001AE36F06|nr:NtaA/DmoA family FMN-dependent monooxygenase [Azospirillum agricola]MBP2231919.1 FMN-dependent oxidoreductase (nitrilotriacetate monooxygenase family) [Azospirillum agricola]
MSPRPIRRQIHLNFHGNTAGEHAGAWTRDSADAPADFVLDYYLRIARIAERGLFDAVFFANYLHLFEGGGRPPRPVIDPVVLASALSVLTERIGFVATASTTFNEPYNIARSFGALDHVSRGRIGWNVVTTYDPHAARNFGLAALPERADRYARADEFVTVVRRLWDSWGPDAVRPAPGGGAPQIDGSRIQHVQHEGRFFSVEGPAQLPRSRQGRPVLFQAGGSAEGRALAARHADAIFSIGLDLSDAQAYYRDVKDRVRAEGRDPDRVFVLPGVYLYLGGTVEEAERKRQSLLEKQTSRTLIVEQLAARLGVEPADLDLDSPVPDHILDRAPERAASRGHTDALVALLRRERPTLREFLTRQPVGGPHRVVIGTPEQVADTLEAWFVNRAADGFNIGNMTPDELEGFVEQVIPILQKRGLFRTGYEGDTLSAHYGLQGA